jgi:SNF2 family DNA or RNA helicase
MAGPRITNNLPFQDLYMDWQNDHQEYDGLFADPGMGKTRMALKVSERAFGRSQIEAMIVVSPNSVKTNWCAWDHMQEDGEIDEVQKHLGTDHVIRGVWLSGATGANKKAWEQFERDIAKPHTKLIILSVNYESFLTEQFFEFMQAFCKKYRTRIVPDESTRIGKPGSQRTKRVTKLGKLAVQKSLLTGTPILKSPMKIFSQARFLSDKALGYTSFFPFRNRYCKMGGFQMKQIVDYKNLDELSEKIATWSFRLKAEDHLKNMPPRDWKKHYVDMTPEQARAYKTMRQEFFAQVDGTEITANIVLAQMTRLQQILGGYISKDGVDHEIIPPAKNPKMRETLSIIEDYRSIVWFRFKPELAGMAQLLRDEGIPFFEFHGGMTDTEKLAVRKAFFRGERQVVLGTTSTGGIGIDEFKVANTVCFFSNDFDTERREQAEKRTWRIGSDKDTLIRYRDILVPNSVDTKIIKVLRGDAQLSAAILKENYREWL